MGCATSKHDDLPAVALCRERCAFLDQAIHHRYAFAEAHLAYLHSLKSVGASLHRFFQNDLDLSTSSSGSPLSPILPHPKDETSSALPHPVKKIHHSHSSSGSHLHFHSESDEDDDSGSDSLHHHPETPTHGQFTYGDHQNLGFGAPPYQVGGVGGFGPPYQVAGAGGFGPPYQVAGTGGFGQPYQVGGGFGAPYQVGGGGGFGAPYQVGGGGLGAPYQDGGGGSGGFMHMNYMRKQTTPSVTYHQRPISPETVRMGEASSSYYPYPYPNSSNPNSYNYPNYPNYAGEFFSSSIQRPYGDSSPPAPSGAGPSSAPSTSKPPPPPPSPPRSSPWDFLNPFETFESNNYPTPYTPSRDSREVREEEGIPDLEDEDFEHEVVKEVHGHQKFVEGESEVHGGNHSKAVAEEEREKQSDSESLYHGRPSASMENEQVEFEVHVVDKKVVDEEGKSGHGGNVAGFKARAFKDDSDVVKEIQVQFEQASESGNELAKMLEVGKLPHNRKNATYQGT